VHSEFSNITNKEGCAFKTGGLIRESEKKRQLPSKAQTSSPRPIRWNEGIDIGKVYDFFGNLFSYRCADNATVPVAD